MSVKRYLSLKTKNYSKNYEKIADFTTENDITRDTAAGTDVHSKGYPSCECYHDTIVLAGA